MKITISGFDIINRTVDVVFEHADVRHERVVHACTDGAGFYDREATEGRVADIARGVEVKIDVGAITNPASFADSAPPAA